VGHEARVHNPGGGVEKGPIHDCVVQLRRVDESEALLTGNLITTLST
jgi:hypothetical protein